MAEAPAAPATTGADAPKPPAVPAAPERPAWLPEKFKTPEDLAKSYMELEKQFHAKKPTTDAPQIPAEPAVPDLPDDAGVEAIVERAGLKSDEIAKTWQEKGALTPEQYAALKKQGYPKGVVDAFIGTQAEAAKQMVAATQKGAEALAGGKAQLTNLLAWAATALPKPEIESLNAELANPKTTLAAVERLIGKHVNAFGAGNAAPLLAGETGPAADSGPFTSQKDILAARKAAEGDPSKMAAYRKRLALTPSSIVAKGL